MTNEERYREALEKIVEQAPRCATCKVITPEGLAPLAEKVRTLRWMTEYACREHALSHKDEGELYREPYRPFVQPAHVTIALAALEAK